MFSQVETRLPRQTMGSGEFAVFMLIEAVSAHSFPVDGDHAVPEDSTPPKTFHFAMNAVILNMSDFEFFGICFTPPEV